MSWSHPLTHPPHRRVGIVGDAVMPPWPSPVKGVALLGVDDVALFVSSFSFAARRLSSDNVRSSFWRMYRPLLSLRFIIMNSQWLTLRRSSKYSTDQWYLEHVSSGLLTHRYVPHHFMRKTRDINPCVTSTHTLGKLSSWKDLHRLSLNPLTRSYASAALSPSGIR